MNIVIHPQDVKATIESPIVSVGIQNPTVEAEIVADTLDAVIGLPIIRELAGGDIYDGSYDVIPTNENQILPTFGKLMAHDLVVEKIPSNYGLITWNGYSLTVS